jgi:hypothetical protein
MRKLTLLMPIIVLGLLNAAFQKSSLKFTVPAGWIEEEPEAPEEVAEGETSEA